MSSDIHPVLERQGRPGRDEVARTVSETPPQRPDRGPDERDLRARGTPRDDARPPISPAASPSDVALPTHAIRARKAVWGKCHLGLGLVLIVGGLVGSALIFDPDAAGERQFVVTMVVVVVGAIQACFGAAGWLNNR